MVSRFDKFRNPSTLPAGTASTAVAAEPASERAAQYLGVDESDSDKLRRRLSGRPGCFAICLDATGSMASLISSARASLAEIVRRVYLEANVKVEIALIAYRDYDMEQRVVESSTLTGKVDDLIAFLEMKVDTFGGGADLGEAVQEALARAHEIEGLSAVLLAGDEPSHERTQLDRMGRGGDSTAHDWALRFKQRDVPIHTFVVGQHPKTVKDFQDIASCSGGRAGRLDGSREMIDMAVMAMLAALKGAQSVLSYMERHKLSQNAGEFGRLLIARPKD